jgi:hypothetical protein
MTPAAIAFMQGDTSPEVLAELRAAMLRWSEQAGDKPLGLNRCMGLGGPRAVRIELRLKHLVDAAAVLPGPSHWARCQQLAEAARAFEIRRWPRWKKLDAPPPDARPVDVHLWHARRVGEELPQTPEAYIGVIPKQNPTAA